MGREACGASLSRQNRRGKWIWRGVIRDGAGLRPDFTATSLGWSSPTPEWKHGHRHVRTHTRLHAAQRNGPRKDDQGQSSRLSLMRGDRWEKTLQTLPIKLTFLVSVCVFHCVRACVFESQSNQCGADTVCTHIHTIPSLWPSCTSWQAGVKAVGAELSGQQEMVLRYLSACSGITNDSDRCR